MTEQTIRPTRADQRLANAVLHLANAFSSNDGFKSAVARAQAARDLVHDIAFPDLACPPSPAAAPSCDAPHCACAEGEDCHANGAAEAVQIVGMDLSKDGLSAHAWTISRVDCTNVGDVVRLSDGREVIQYMIPSGTSFDKVKEALHLTFGHLHGDNPFARGLRRHDRASLADAIGTEIRGDTAARLDGLSAKLDAMAERLPHPDAHMIRVVSPTEIEREGEFDLWYLDPRYQGHVAPFAMGDAVLDASGYYRIGFWQMLSVGQRYGDKKIQLRLKQHPGFMFDTEAF